MPRSLLRSFLSAVVTACFAAGVLAWGSAPECAGTPTGKHHQHEHGQRPVSQACAVHLCCVHLDPGAPTTIAALRVTLAFAHGGFAPVPALAGPRPEHALPFAHAPPPVTI